MKRKIILISILSIMAVVPLLAGCTQASSSEPTPEPAVLNIEMTPTGHWHATRAKTLTFAVTDESGNPVTGLSPTVAIKSHGSDDVRNIAAADNGDGSYSADYTANDVGSGYSLAYSVSFSFEYEHNKYFDAWPVEVVRDGNEGIMPTIGGTRYAYQVRYGWDPGHIDANDEEKVNLIFEPRRATQTGDQINIEQPWQNTFNHIPGLEATVLVESTDGSVSETLTATYIGLGIYRAQRIFSEAEVGARKEYKVSFLFTDTFNNFTIDKEETSYPLVAVEEH